MKPILVIDDIVATDRSLILLPSVPRAGLPIVAGDAVDLCTEHGRHEIRVLAVEPDPKNAAMVRLRITSTVFAARGVEVWPSEASSRIVLSRPTGSVHRLAPGDVVRVSGAISRASRR